MSEAKEARETAAMSAAGYWIGYVHGAHAEQIINDAAGGIARAVESAMRVTITPEILAAAREGWRSAEGSWADDPGPREVARLAAAFKAAGFEVVP